MFPKNSQFDQVDNNTYYEAIRKGIEDRSIQVEVTESPQQERTSKLVEALDDIQEALAYENYDVAERLLEDARKLV